MDFKTLNRNYVSVLFRGEFHSCYRSIINFYEECSSRKVFVEVSILLLLFGDTFLSIPLCSSFHEGSKFIRNSCCRFWYLHISINLFHQPPPQIKTSSGSKHTFQFPQDNYPLKIDTIHVPSKPTSSTIHECIGSLTGSLFMLYAKYTAPPLSARTKFGAPSLTGERINGWLSVNVSHSHPDGKKEVGLQ